MRGLLYEFPAETWLTVYRRLDKTGRKGISLSESNSKADFRQTPHFGDHRRQTILSRPHVIRNKSQAHSCFRLFLFIETGSRKHDQNKKEVSKLQLELFSILLTSAFVFVFVLLLRLYCLSLIFLFIFSLFQLSVVMRCVVLLDVRDELFVLLRFFSVVGGFALLLIARVRCVSVLRCKCLASILTDALVCLPPCSNNVVLCFLSSAF